MGELYGKLYLNKAVRTEQKRIVSTHPRDEILLRNKKEQAIDTHHNLDESQVHSLSERSQAQKATHWDSIYSIFGKRPNHGERKHIGGLPGAAGGTGIYEGYR